MNLKFLMHKHIAQHVKLSTSMLKVTIVRLIQPKCYRITTNHFNPSSLKLK